MPMIGFGDNGGVLSGWERFGAGILEVGWYTRDVAAESYGEGVGVRRWNLARSVENHFAERPANFCLVDFIDCLE